MLSEIFGIKQNQNIIVYDGLGLFSSPRLLWLLHLYGFDNVFILNLANKLKKFDKLNLDYIKFGLLSKNKKNLFDKIKFLRERKFKTKLVCVVFVDISDHFNLVYKKLDLFDACGIKYIMLDTYDKNNGDLLSFCNISNLDKFISKCKKFDIKIGLAGSLKETHIPLMMKLKPNILGFRSAICKFNKRMSEVDTRKLKKISRHFNLCNNKAIETAGA